MRLGYFTMPLHPLHRDNTELLHEDRDTIIYADALGFMMHLLENISPIKLKMLPIACCS